LLRVGAIQLVCVDPKHVGAPDMVLVAFPVVGSGAVELDAVVADAPAP
jgi:hypothetical protein